MGLFAVCVALVGVAKALTGKPKLASAMLYPRVASWLVLCCHMRPSTHWAALESGQWQCQAGLCWFTVGCYTSSSSVILPGYMQIVGHSSW